MELVTNDDVMSAIEAAKESAAYSGISSVTIRWDNLNYIELRLDRIESKEVEITAGLITLTVTMLSGRQHSVKKQFEDIIETICQIHWYMNGR